MAKNKPKKVIVNYGTVRRLTREERDHMVRLVYREDSKAVAKEYGKPKKKLPKSPFIMV